MVFRLPEIRVINRETGELEREQVYGEKVLALLYGQGWLSKTVGKLLQTLLSRFSFVSAFYGWLMRRPASKKKIKPFINQYKLNPNEFMKQAEQFESFDDFFCRKLKPESRPIALGDEVAIIPADGRYWFCPHIASADSFLVKGRRYEIGDLLGDQLLAKQYADGSLVQARLCPTDYHRFHFACNGLTNRSQLINGLLRSVNPVAICRWFDTFTENKRMVSHLLSDQFGRVICIEIGATAVGSIHQTYTPERRVEKGAEKGYFSFGGSALILLFEPGKIEFETDLLAASASFKEIRCLLGQPMGKTVENQAARAG